MSLRCRKPHRLDIPCEALDMKSSFMSQESQLPDMRCAFDDAMFSDIGWSRCAAMTGGNTFSFGKAVVLESAIRTQRYVWYLARITAIMQTIQMGRAAGAGKRCPCVCSLSRTFKGSSQGASRKGR